MSFSEVHPLLFLPHSESPALGSFRLNERAYSYAVVSPCDFFFFFTLVVVVRVDGWARACALECVSVCICSSYIYLLYPDRLSI